MLAVSSRIVMRAALAALLVLSAVVTPQTQEGRWAKEMAAFDQQDAKPGQVSGRPVFVGSSSIRLWDLEKSFPQARAINRGFGGSQIADSVANVERLVIRHNPRTVVFYAGDNDIASGKTPATVATDYKAFVQKVHAALPKTRIAFIAIKPSIQRWALIDKVREANALIRDYARTDDRLAFIDVDGPMLGWDEKPRADLFVDDGLHLSAKGYELWTALVKPFLECDC